MTTRREYRGHNVVFVVGCPRSGTTWVQRLLASHPQILTGQESHLFARYIGPQLRAWRADSDPRKWSGRGAVGLECYFREQEYVEILRAYMLNLLEPMIGHLQPHELFLEKTPLHALFIPEIKELLPESRIISILRDPRDVVASLLAASRSWGRSWAPRDVRTATNLWARYIGAVRESTAGLSPDHFIEIRYEGLHADPYGVLRKVSQFLGVEWDETGIGKAVERNSLEEARRSGGTTIPVGGEGERISGPSVREPEEFLRRGHPGGWRKDLSWFERFQVWRRIHNTMDQVGYSWSVPS